MSQYIKPPRTITPEKPASFVGIILSVERHNDSPLSRSTIIVDAVDERLDLDLVEKRVRSWNHRYLALLRIMTTSARFAQMAKLVGPDDPEGEEDLEGRWVQLDLVPVGKVSGPRAQVSRLGERGYEDIEIFTVADITDLGREPVEPRSLGAAARTGAAIAGKLRKRRKLRGTRIATTAARREIARLLRLVRQATFGKVVVHDVGHASFTTLMDSSGSPLLHFDAGWPIPMNWKTYPQLEPNPPFTDLVVLSHWDWDHLHGYHRWMDLKSSFWVVPDQILGPNGELVVEELKASKRLIRVPPNSAMIYTVGQVMLSQGDPSSVSGKSKKRNNSGLVLNVTLVNGENVLIPGDADYIAIPNAVAAKPDLLVVPHHGAAVQGSIPVPHRLGGTQIRAVVSMGLGNCYQHPSLSDVLAHDTAGWGVVSFTSAPPAGTGYTTVARGDKVLG